MGTNYYACVDVCECCKRPAEKIHIGKKSAGWRFTFHAADDNDSWEDWKKFLQRKDVEIRNEYGELTPFEYFVHIVECERYTGENHYDYCCKRHPMEMDWLTKDPEGYCFDRRDFS